MRLLPLHRLEDIREAFSDIVGPWVSKGPERKVVMEAANDSERGLLAVKVSMYGDSVDSSDVGAVDAAKRRDLTVEVDAAYLEDRFSGELAAELRRLRDENGELRERIDESVAQLRVAYTLMQGRGDQSFQSKVAEFTRWLEGKE